jgi:hypothetical protein
MLNCDRELCHFVILVVLHVLCSSLRPVLNVSRCRATMMLSSCFIMRIVIGTDCVILCHCIGVHRKPLLIQLLAMLQLKLQ